MYVFLTHILWIFITVYIYKEVFKTFPCTCIGILLCNDLIYIMKRHKTLQYIFTDSEEGCTVYTGWSNQCLCVFIFSYFFFKELQSGITQISYLNLELKIELFPVSLIWQLHLTEGALPENQYIIFWVQVLVLYVECCALL